ncbi:ATP-binding protein [Leucobacter weissii]|uniref:ATP-binding protein n=1 Tax=Leucobacter weissii TaxID=1983706 RepID=A0A939MKR9_9MICO|nr:ATP-binding protein [Leucobacter weissii]MBO1902789.1 ATP-binding protein [Leucobacter weissii]
MTEPTARRQPNPYRPGFNQAPVVFAGRGEVLDAANEALDVAALDGRTPRPVVLVGPRGVGKTVTLGEISQLAAQRSWPTVHVEARAGSLVAELGDRLRAARNLFDGREPAASSRRRTRITGAKVEASVLGIGGGIEIERAADDRESEQRGGLGAELRGVMRAATAQGSGLLLALDELQNASSAELHELGAVLQEHVADAWPLVVVIAALPSFRGKRGGRMPTYLERAEWHALEGLAAPDAREALLGPAEQSGRPMTDGAADALLALAGGYPYAIQVAGHFAWRASHGAKTITEQHAAAAAPRIGADLDQLFLSRWEDASPREREYLAALAEAEILHSEPHGGQVAAVLGQRVSAVSYLRDRLIKKGTIYRDGAGGLRFITPGMGDWVRRGTRSR